MSGLTKSVKSLFLTNNKCPTGLFIAPVRGAYHFEFYIAAHGHPSHPIGAILVKNGQNFFIAYQHQQDSFGKSANGITLLLEVGDTVFLRQWINTRIFDNENHHSTFSGHLLFTMQALKSASSITLTVCFFKCLDLFNLLQKCYHHIMRWRFPKMQDVLPVSFVLVVSI